MARSLKLSEVFSFEVLNTFESRNRSVLELECALLAVCGCWLRLPDSYASDHLVASSMCAADVVL